MTIKSFSGALICWTLLCGCSPPSSGDLQLKLPKDLREISGLSLTPDGNLLAVADEKAHIFKIDVEASKVEKFTKFGDPVARGDFEGITLHDGTLYLVTSDGALWQRRLDAEPEAYQVFDTGVGRRCEVEGLTVWPQEETLFILCKNPRDPALKGQLAVFAWSLAQQALSDEHHIVVPLAAYGIKKLQPSAISFSADGERLFIVAGPQAAFVEISLSGELARAGKLPKHAKHTQTEGVVISAQNTLYLADEGGKGRGKLTRYANSF